MNGSLWKGKFGSFRIRKLMGSVEDKRSLTSFLLKSFSVFAFFQQLELNFLKLSTCRTSKQVKAFGERIARFLTVVVTGHFFLQPN